MAVAAGLAVAVLLTKASVHPRSSRTSSACHCEGGLNQLKTVHDGCALLTTHHKVHHINSQK